MASPVVVDPLTRRLARGDVGRDDTWGLNLNLASPPPPELYAPYAELAARLAAEGVTSERAGAYVYPFHTLHITCASPAPFTHCALRREERAPFMAGWAAALAAEAAADPAFPRAPFPLVYDRVTLEPAAAIFRVEDPTGAVARVRALVARCMRHEAVAGLPDDAAGRSACRIPGIVHTTFLRFGAPPSVPEAALRAAFDAAAATWRPVTVMCDALRLVEEDAIYMHLDLTGRDRDRVLLELPFRAAPPGAATACGEGAGAVVAAAAHADLAGAAAGAGGSPRASGVSDVGHR